MLSETLPYNDEAEKTVIGALLIGGDVNILIAEVGLKASDFYFEQNRAVYLAIMQLYDKNKVIDIVTVDNELKGDAGYSGINFIKAMAQAVPTTRHIKYYAEIIKQMSQRRYYIALGAKMQEIAADCSKDISAVNDMIENAMISNNQEISAIAFDNVFLSAYKDMVQAYEKKGEIPGEKTGWISLDTAIGGLEGLVVVGARPSMGKTMFGVNIAEHVTFQEGKVSLIFSLEMSKNQIGIRIISSQTGTRHSDCKFGTLTERDFTSIGQFDMSHGTKMIICDEPMLDINKIKSVSRRYKKQFGSIGVIVVDYIQLMDTGNNGRNATRTDEIGKISRGLKLLSKELDCPIVALSQLSRRVEERSDKRPMLADLRDSGAIEQDADTILFLYRDDYYNKQSQKKGIAEIIISKARNGETGTIELSFQPQIMRFIEKIDIEKIRRIDNGIY